MANVVMANVVMAVVKVYEVMATDLDVDTVERLHTARTAPEKEKRHVKPGIKPAAIVISSIISQPHADLPSLLLLPPPTQQLLQKHQP